jgi:hypothetical protein
MRGLFSILAMPPDRPGCPVSARQSVGGSIAQAAALPETVVFKWDDWPPEEEGSIVQFRLLYRGKLKSSNSDGRPKDKHDIRRYLHPQLRELWFAHPGLGEQAKDREKIKQHYFNRNGFNFLSLIGSRPGRIIGCRLNILFLRRGLPGDLVGAGRGQRGDIDNRLKVFLDGLKIPKEAGDLKAPWGEPGQDEDPFYCLLEDDNLITEINITSDRLLLPRRQCACLECDCDGRDTTNENYVEIVLGVESFMMDDGPYPDPRWS